LTLQWVDSAGNRAPLPVKSGAFGDPRLSPDGGRIALMATEGGRTDIWVYDVYRDAMTRLTFGGGFFQAPVWSPDGRYIVYDALPKGISQLRADGASQPQPLIETNFRQIPWSFTPDGKRLAYEDESEGRGQIWTVPLEEQVGQLKAGKPQQFLKSSFNDRWPSFSPDGRWLAYGSDESGKYEVYVRAVLPSSRAGGKWQVSNNGGSSPKWSRNGHELLYRSGIQVMSVSYTVNGDTFVAGKPRVWIEKLGTVVSGWDLAPDGKRVLVLSQAESAEQPKPEHEVVFLANFFDDLRRRAPMGK
jgi:serine/threonine-protein kinase